MLHADFLLWKLEKRSVELHLHRSSIFAFPGLNKGYQYQTWYSFGETSARALLIDLDSWFSLSPFHMTSCSKITSSSSLAWTQRVNHSENLGVLFWPGHILATLCLGPKTPLCLKSNVANWRLCWNLQNIGTSANILRWDSESYEVKSGFFTKHELMTVTEDSCVAQRATNPVGDLIEAERSEALDLLHVIQELHRL